THSQWSTNTDHPDDEEGSTPLRGQQVLRMPRVQLSMVMFSMGAMVESLAGIWIASILLQRFSVSESQASIGAGIYWIGLTLARAVVPVFWRKTTPFAVQRWS